MTKIVVLGSKPNKDNATTATTEQVVDEVVNLEPVDNEVVDTQPEEQKVEETPATEEVKPKAEEMEETVEIKDKIVDDWNDEFDDSIQKSDSFKTPKYGSGNYTIASDSLDISIKDKKQIPNQPPIMVWARDFSTLRSNYSRIEARVNDESYRYTNSARRDDLMMASLYEANRMCDETIAAAVTSRDGAKWANYMPKEERKVRNSVVSYTQDANGLDTADKQTAMLMRQMGLGIPMIIRLWHSGLIFSINPPGKDQYITMVEKLNIAHLETLRRTNGLIHGVSTYYANRIVIETFMSLVTESNLDRIHWGEVNNLVDHRDIQAMAYGILAAAHPNGYNYLEICGGYKTLLNDDGTVSYNDDGEPRKSFCGNYKESVIDLRLLNILDETMFTEWQRDIMSRPLSSSKVTLEDLHRYRSEGLIHAEDRIGIDENVTIIVKAPNAQKHIDTGEHWITSIEAVVDEMIGADIDGEQKNNLMVRQIEATFALDVSHWVVGIEVDGVLYDNSQAIENVFRNLSNRAEMRDKIFDKIREKINSRVGSLFAVPTTRCPVCQTMSNDLVDNGTAFYTPLDMVGRFFTLAGLNM